MASEDQLIRLIMNDADYKEIADLSVNHIEYYAIRCGFSVERVASDYGYDLQIYTYDENGEFENGTIYVQLKATDFIEKHK